MEVKENKLLRISKVEFEPDFLPIRRKIDICILHICIYTYQLKIAMYRVWHMVWSEARN